MRDEAQVVGYRQQRFDPAAAEAQQKVQGRTQEEVRHRDPSGEQHRGRREERQGPAPLAAVQAGGDEGPELVQPDRRREEHTGDQRDPEPDEESVGRVGEDQVAALAAGAPYRRQLAVGVAQEVEDRVIRPHGDHDRDDHDSEQAR